MPQIIRNTKFKQVLPDNFTYKGVKYTKAYYKDNIMFGQSNEYKDQYFTIESLEDGNTITLTIGSGVTSSQMTYVAYSTDGTNWTQTNVDSTTQTINVNLDEGDKVYWKGVGNQLTTDNTSTDNQTVFSSTKNYIAYGNIASLLFGDNFSSINSFANGSSYNYAALFFASSKLKNIDNLVLPFTTLVNKCYSSIFRGAGITECKMVLPATEIAQAAYENMFRDCTSLITPPKMHVTSFTGTNNMQYMFFNCTSLIEAPELPATSLPLAVYQYMFRQCTSLKKAPELPATTLSQYCYRNMFYGCTSLVQAPALPATTLQNSCYYEMFRGCTSLVEAPDLPATTLKNSCYYFMFYQCTSLKKAPSVLPAATLVDSCYRGMFYKCGYINEITCLATDISATDCTTSWLDQVASTGIFYKDPSMNDWTLNSPSGIPTGWTVYGTTQHTVTLTVNNQAYGNVTGAGTYYYNQECTIKAYAVLGYRFVGWYDGNTLISNLDGYIFTVTQDVSWQAVFEEAVIDYSEEYFTLETDAYTDVITIYNRNHSTNFTSFEYSTDGGNNWISVTWGNNPHHDIFTNANFKTVKIRSVCTNFTGVLFYSGDDSSWKVYGNINSLVYGSNFSNQTSLPISDQYTKEGCSFDGVWRSSENGGLGGFVGLFTEMNIVSAENLVLPASSLTYKCYFRMFYNCKNLENAPALPATTLAKFCYADMFRGCEKLKTMPALPAATVERYAYDSMFRECTSLSSLAAISATYVDDYGCRYMFYQCTALKSLPTLNATYVGISGYEMMFGFCTGLGSISFSLPATEGGTSCYDRMFYECNNLRGAVSLNLTIVPYYGYNYMFFRTNIQNIWCYSVDAMTTSSVRLTFGIDGGYSIFKYRVLRKATSTIINAKPTNWTLAYID